MPYNLSRYEQETHINWNEETDSAHIYTTSPRMIKKLDALAKAYPDVYEARPAGVINGETVSRDYYVPVHYLGFKKPPTEKQREARRKAAANNFKRL